MSVSVNQGCCSQAQSITCPPGCQGGIYTVQPGDTMFLIARRFNVSLDALIGCNPQIPNPSLIVPGQQVCIPTAGAPRCAPNCQGGIYVVRPGDTMFSIANRLGVSVDALIACNPQVPNPNILFPGQALCTPTGATPVCQPQCQGGIYTVVPGDTMLAISARLGVPLEALIACNPQVPDPNLLVPGQKLCVPERPVPRLPCCIVLHQVTPVPGSSALGVALVRQLVQPGPDNFAVTVAAHALPAPSQLDDFDAYEAVVIQGSVEFRERLQPTSEVPPTWAGTLVNLPPLTAQATVLVRPLNTQTGVPGPAQLRGALADCR